MKRLILILFVSTVFLVSCDKDEPIVPKDYGLKNFVADLGYDSEAGWGEVKYKTQTYFAFGEDDPIAIGNYGLETWTDFNVISDHPDYNISTDIVGWNLLFTNYTTGVYNPDTGETEPYGVTGTLINVESNIQVAKVEYTESEDPAVISQAFAELVLDDVAGLEYSTDIKAIGYKWKRLTGDFPNFTYVVNDNWFYIVRMENGDTFKFRFIGFYGDSMDEREVKIEYQLMQ
jgi:hypothetical protein